MNQEYRTFAGEELRVDRPAGGPAIIRMSLRFNSLSVPLGGFMRFREQIDPGAFDSVLNDQAREVMAYWGHDVNMPLGRRSRGTLRLSKTETLLKAEIDAPDTTWGRDAVTAIERGDVEGMSFRFMVLPEGEKWFEDRDKNLIRTLTNVDLQEVSPTAEPAYTKSSASVRSAESVWERHGQEIAALEKSATDMSADRQRRDRLIRSDLSRIS
jgi:uncharacterized protein